MSKKDTRIAVLGDGGWGTTLSLLLADKGFQLSLWGYFPAYIEEMRRSRENVKFLPGFRMPENIRLTSSLKEVLQNADILVLAVPAQHLRGVLSSLKKEGGAKKKYVIVGKGIETESSARGVKAETLIVASDDDAYSFGSGKALQKIIAGSEFMGLSRAGHGTAMFTGTFLEDDLVKWLKK